MFSGRLSIRMQEHSAALDALLCLPLILLGFLFLMDAGARRGDSRAQRFVSAYCAAPPARRLAGLLLAITATVHLGLVPSHSSEPLTALLFALDGVALAVLSGLVFLYARMRAAALGLLAASLAAYALYLVLGLESPDAVGLVTKLVEVVAAALFLYQWAGTAPKEVFAR